MPPKRLVAVFASAQAAEAAKQHLLRAGLAEAQVTVSRRLTDDGLAAEAPGQSYMSMFEGGDGISEAVYADAVHAAGAVLSVEVDGRSSPKVIAELLAREGATQTFLRS